MNDSILQHSNTPVLYASASRWWAWWLRLFLAAMWLTQAIGKLNPSFGDIRGIVRVMALGNSAHPEGNPIGFFKRFLLDYVLPHWQLFGLLVTMAEMAVGLALLFGVATRLAALGGIFLQLQYAFGRAYLEWSFVYPAIILALIVLVWTAPGRVLGVDAVLARKWPKWPIW